jgi:hypothetical protein
VYASRAVRTSVPRVPSTAQAPELAGDYLNTELKSDFNEDSVDCPQERTLRGSSGEHPCRHGARGETGWCQQGAGETGSGKASLSVYFVVIRQYTVLRVYRDGRTRTCRRAVSAGFCAHVIAGWDIHIQWAVPSGSTIQMRYLVNNFARPRRGASPVYINSPPSPSRACLWSHGSA